MPNPTDTTRALVERFEMYLTSAIYHPSISNKRDVEAARAALLAHVAGVEQRLARYKEIYESNSAAFIAIRKAFGIEADETVVPYILKYAPPLATRPTEARDDG